MDLVIILSYETYTTVIWELKKECRLWPKDQKWYFLCHSSTVKMSGFSLQQRCSCSFFIAVSVQTKCSKHRRSSVSHSNQKLVSEGNHGALEVYSNGLSLLPLSLSLSPLLPFWWNQLSHSNRMTLFLTAWPPWYTHTYTLCVSHRNLSVLWFACSAPVVRAVLSLSLSSSLPSLYHFILASSLSSQRIHWSIMNHSSWL